MNTRYKCIRCGTCTSASSHPTTGGCSKGDEHEWVVEDGKPKRYKCIRCGTCTSASSHPTTGGCSKGGEHEWVVD
jgi:succinate dehydrogenase/fumarate reductase-like Fe-S protein